MNKVVIGFTGQMGSGKGAASEFLVEKYNAKMFKFSTPLKDIARRMYLEYNRINTQTISTMFRRYFGEDILSKVILGDIKNDETPIIVLEGIRRESDYKLIKDEFTFYLVFIDAKIKIRFDRTVSRNDKSDDSSKSFEEFQKDHKREADQQIAGLKDKADFIVNNDGTLEELHQQIDKIVQEIMSK